MKTKTYIVEVRGSSSKWSRSLNVSDRYPSIERARAAIVRDGLDFLSYRILRVFAPKTKIVARVLR
jgi:hypothetical protein